MKHFVICGPELTDLQFVIGREYIWKLFNDGVTSADVALTLTFPEAEYGAQQVRTIIDTAMESGTQIFLATRYEPALNYLLDLEAKQKYRLKNGDVVTLLFRNKDCIEPTVHKLGADGFLDSWPYGVLW
jgi:hypothetical protein